MKYIIISVVAILVFLYFFAVFIAKLEPVIPRSISNNIDESKENSVFIDEYICIAKPETPFKIEEIWLEKSCSYLYNKLDTVYESKEQLVFRIERFDKANDDFRNINICNTDARYITGFIEREEGDFYLIYVDKGIFSSKRDTIKVFLGDTKCRKIKYELSLLKISK